MSGKQRSLIDELRERGIRITPQRVIIFDAIERLRGHVTADDIYQEVQKDNPYISLATVYRTLELLQDLKLVTQTNLGRSQTFYALQGHGLHHHTVCTECGDIAEFEDALLDPLRTELRERFGFECHVEHMSVFGLCAKCRQKKAAEN
ncbi:MAG: transcriptional repressor [Chloroflexi bacterium]|nr:MAG: transcriptional repressor [Chloroflexota bacterium]